MKVQLFLVAILEVNKAQNSFMTINYLKLKFTRISWALINKKS